MAHRARSAPPRISSARARSSTSCSMAPPPIVPAGLAAFAEQQVRRRLLRRESARLATTVASTKRRPCARQRAIASHTSSRGIVHGSGLACSCFADRAAHVHRHHLVTPVRVVRHAGLRPALLVGGAAPPPRSSRRRAARPATRRSSPPIVRGLAASALTHQARLGVRDAAEPRRERHGQHREVDAHGAAGASGNRPRAPRARRHGDARHQLAGPSTLLWTPSPTKNSSTADGAAAAAGRRSRPGRPARSARAPRHWNARRRSACPAAPRGSARRPS